MSDRGRKLSCGIVSLLIIVAATSLWATDHVDGPETFTHRSGDISDLFAFPSPHERGVLVLAMNVYPLVNRKGHFSDKIVYRFTVRPASVAGRGVNTAFSTTATYTFDCTFETPHRKPKDHRLTCKFSKGLAIQARVDDENGASADGIRVFAGRRADPFLLNIKNFASLSNKRLIPQAEGRNDMNHLNVLSIVIAFQVDKFVPPTRKAPLLAIVGETLAPDLETSQLRRIDRVGRPEITNALLTTREEKPELRDLYNQSNPFAIQSQQRRRFAQRLHESVRYYDGLDGTIDWLPRWETALVKLLLNDYLVVDPSKPFAYQSYFDIERSMLRSQPHTRAGGRVPHENILNSLFTTLVNGGHGPEVANGIATRKNALPTPEFPYLAKPHRNPWSSLKTFIGGIGASRIAK